MENHNQEQESQVIDSGEVSLKKKGKEFNFLQGILVALALFAAQFIAMIIGALVALAIVGVDGDNFMGVTTGVGLILAFPIAVWIIFRKRSLEASALKWENSFWLLIPISFLMTFCTSYIVSSLVQLLPTYEKMVSQYAEMIGTIDPKLLFVGGVIIGPICEEIIFRGIILKGFLKTYDYKKAILFSAIIFSFIHMVPIQVITTFFIGLVLGYVYYKTRSLWLVCIIHILNNLVAVLVGTEGMESGEITRDLFSSDLLFIGSLALSAVGVYLSYILFEKVYRTNVIQEEELIV